MTSTSPPDIATIVDLRPELIYPGFGFDRGLPRSGPGSRPRFTKRRGTVDWDAPGTPEVLKIVVHQATMTVLARVYRRQDRTIATKLRPATLAAIPAPDRTALALFAASLARTSALAYPCLDAVQIRTLVLTSAARALEDWADGRRQVSAYLGVGPDLAKLFSWAMIRLRWPDYAFPAAVLDLVDLAVEDELAPRYRSPAADLTGTIIRPPTGGTVERHH